MSIPKAFDFAGCLEVTFILRDFKTVTGRIVDKFDHRKKDDDKCCKEDDKKHDDKCCKEDDKKHDDKCCKEDDKKHDDKCCDVKVEVDDKCDFILVELTKDAQSVSLLEIEFEEENYEEEIEIKIANVKFREGSCIALNVCDIIYAGVDAKIDIEEIEIELEDHHHGGNNLTTTETTTTP